MKIDKEADFSIIIDFDKKSPNPSRVFESMSLLIKSFEQLDRDLVKHIDNKIEPVLILEDVEKGSLKTILANVLKGIPDEAIEDLDWKKMIGIYLVKAKYICLNKMEGKISLNDGSEIEAIEMELINAAKETGVDQLPSYIPTNKRVIIKNLETINRSLEPLSVKDRVYYKSEEGNATFNMDLSIDFDSMEDLITKEVIDSVTTMILKVKKPDYLGDSQWVFKHGNGNINAKILDGNWLDSFQNRNIDVRPQNSLVCRVKTIVKYDYNFEVLSTTYEIIEVVRINPRPNDTQITLL